MSADAQLAVVMSGGGARAAYQAGLLHAIGRRHPRLRVPIIAGVSAGAINAAWMASSCDEYGQTMEELVELWRSLKVENIFRVDAWSLSGRVLRTGLKLVSGGARRASTAQGFVDTQPLRGLLASLVGGEGGVLERIAPNIESGKLRAVALTGASYSTGESVTWVQGREFKPWERAQRVCVPCTLTVEHIMASASLPIFFPAVRVGAHWYGDGGMRLTAPLSPAVHLGATKIIAISTRCTRTRGERSQPMVEDYPPTAQVAGALFNSIFLDQFDGDALQLERTNELVARLPSDQRVGLRPIDLLVLRPSRDLGKLANDHEPKLPPAFRFLTRGLGTKETRSNDLLSLVMFQHDYLSRLVELGMADGEARAGEIEEFLAR
ncbi:MAG: patatin-like phospholipase family protein [Planctomycetia bacterium]|jgi:NTE family protein